jgi:hypothetical protein
VKLHWSGVRGTFEVWTLCHRWVKGVYVATYQEQTTCRHCLHVIQTWNK